MHELNAMEAAGYAALALGHVRREYPNAPGLVLGASADLRRPSALHPVFYGSFDWHSCVHGYWMLARLLLRFPSLEQAGAIRALFDEQLTKPKVAGECAYFERPLSKGFERPYGWAWLLKLQSALLALDGPWADALAPLAALIADRLRGWLPRADYPIRTGSHSSTAFALTLCADYADATGDAKLLESLAAKAADWYGLDEACQAWEPSGDDFLSPALIEALCMLRLLPPAQFDIWFARFLPALQEGLPAVLFVPARVADRTDGKTAHLDGLNLSRAWCWRELARAAPVDDRRHTAMLAAAERHLAAALPHVDGDYMGSHWLATYAVLALEA